MSSAVLELAKNVQHLDCVRVACKENSCSDMFIVVSDSFTGQQFYSDPLHSVIDMHY